jgi:large subunit ribosomal protein L23
MRDPHQIIKRPHLTEKGSVLSDKVNQYVFEVAPDANKVEIKHAVETLFKVKVVTVNTMVRKGKVKGLGNRSWQRPSVKRALVKLAEGQNIEFV